jgi:heme exporter protein C
MYLVRRKRGWDRLAHASAEVGTLLITLTLITGAIWAKPIWGVWWQWEPRLTTAFVLWLVYVAYLMVRAYAPNKAQGAKFASVIGIVGFVNVPITYMSVKWWRTVHPEHVVGPIAPEGALSPEIGITLMFSFLAFWVFIAALLIERVAQRRLEDDVEAMKHVLAEPVR